MDLVNEVKLGSTKGTALEVAVEKNYNGECKEVGLYLAMARQAQREGFPEISQALKQIAFEEAEHGAHYAELNGLISSNTKENLENMLKGELMANEGKFKSASRSADEGIEDAQAYFDESSKDEARHAQILNGLIKRYF